VPAVGPGELPPYAIGVPGKAEVTIADNDVVNFEPTVAIVAPEGLELCRVPFRVLLKARAEDSDGTVSGVVFYRGDTVIGPGVAEIGRASCREREWISVVAGSYEKKALATDNGGANKTEATGQNERVTMPVNTKTV